MSVTEEQRDGLVERLFAATLGMSEVLTVYLGDTLGLYRALNQNGPMTAPQLATDTGISLGTRASGSSSRRRPGS